MQNIPHIPVLYKEVIETFKDIKESMNKVNELKTDPLGVKSAIFDNDKDKIKTEEKGEA